MIVSQIAAMAKNRSIGLDNNLPWHIPEDMKFFRDTTKDRICIYGRKTYESLGYKPFPKRPNIVISRNPDQVPNKEAVIVVSSLEAALEVARGQTDKWGQEVFICGGAEIYKLAIPFIKITREMLFFQSLIKLFLKKCIAQKEQIQNLLTLLHTKKMEHLQNFKIFLRS
jgi:dihydrofolate reductase